MAEQQNDEPRNSLVDLFSKDELKTLFLRYLIIIGCLEILIFIVAFFSILEPYKIPFPWREYFFAAFTIPIAITFILGLIIIAFNTYYFRDNGHFDELKSSFKDDPEKASKTKIFLKLSWQFQYLVFLLLLGMGALILFHLNDILMLIANAGEKALNAVLILAGILLTGTVLMGLLYMWFHFRLSKKRMEYAHQYKFELMNRNGILLLDDNTLIDSNGKVINGSDPALSAKEIAGGEVSLLPSIKGQGRKAD